MSLVSPTSPVLYNLDDHVGKSYSSKAMESFYPSELQRALREQSFGIAGYELLRPTSSLEASAFVTLLEGDVINISLSSRGYQVVRNPRCASPPQTGKIFEAIESLLQAISPRYERRRREILVARLERLS